MKKTFAFLLTALLLCTSFFLTGISADYYFTDVSPSDWFYEDVKYAAESGLMNGTDNTKFSPDGLTNRGMIVTVLWRLEGEPETAENPFEDVKIGTYYYKAVSWAFENKIVTGYDESHFAPELAATREQIAAIIHRYATYKKYDLSGQSLPGSYIDSNQIAPYAVECFEWAYANGIISGTSDKTLSPKDCVKRCQVAAILKRLCTGIGEIKATSPEEEKESHGDGNKASGLTGTPGASTGSSPPPNKPESTGVPTVFVDDIYAAPGDEVSVAVRVKSNPGILGMTLTVYYDNSLCTLVSAENGEAFRGILDLTPPGVLENGARFIWDGIEISGDMIKDGEILLMKFKVRDDAENGACPITLKLFDGDVLNNALEEIYLRTQNGNIVIK